MESAAGGAAVTAQSTLVGFVLGTLLGVVLAAAIVHSRTLDRALLPWIVASQTVPVLAIAPIVLVILGSLGFSGVAPKAAIAMYLCFFPVTVACVQGLRSPQRIETELMHTLPAWAARLKVLPLVAGREKSGNFWSSMRMPLCCVV